MLAQAIKQFQDICDAALGDKNKKHILKLPEARKTVVFFPDQEPEVIDWPERRVQLLTRLGDIESLLSCSTVACDAEDVTLYCSPNEVQVLVEGEHTATIKVETSFLFESIEAMAGDAVSLGKQGFYEWLQEYAPHFPKAGELKVMASSWTEFMSSQSTTSRGPDGSKANYMKELEEGLTFTGVKPADSYLASGAMFTDPLLREFFTVPLQFSIDTTEKQLDIWVRQTDWEQLKIDMLTCLLDVVRSMAAPYGELVTVLAGVTHLESPSFA